MKNNVILTAVGCALCIAAVGALSGCSDDKNISESVSISTSETTKFVDQTESSTQTEEEAIMQSIPITSDNAKLQSRTVTKDGVLWLVQSGSAAEFTVSGKNVSLTLAGSISIKDDEAHRPRYAVYADDKLICDVVMDKQEETVSLWEDTDKTALVKVMLLSEAQFGGVGICSVNAESSSAQPVTPTDEASLKIEFIGDSITCAYGVEGVFGDTFSTSTENFTKSFAYLTAKALDADYTTCCYSGYGIVSGFSADGSKNEKDLLPQCYGMSSNYADYVTDWDFSEQCDVVVINLGTNDINYVAADPEDHGKEFKNGYKAFLQTVREKRPDAAIICTVGTMGGDDVYKLIEAAIAELGDENITSFFSPSQSAMDDMGTDGHPSKKTQQYIADILTDKIRNLLTE
jgi:lysophospholipase L1-like esterase